MPLDLSQMNPQQLQFLLSMFSGQGGGGLPQLPGANIGTGPGQMTPQQAQMSQMLNPQASPMQQVLQRLTQLQAMQQQPPPGMAGPGMNMGNPLMAGGGANPQAQALLRMMLMRGGGQLPAGGAPQYQQIDPVGSLQPIGMVRGLAAQGLR